MLKPRIRETVSPLSYHVPEGIYPGVTGGGGFLGSNESEALTKFQAFALRPAVRKSYSFTGIETMTDFVTPNFHEIVKENGFRPINPMSKTLKGVPLAVTDVEFQVFGDVKNVGGQVVGEGHSFYERFAEPVPVAASIASSEDINALQLEAKASLLGAGMDYATSLAEFRETMGMFLNMKQNLLNRRDATLRAWSKDLTHKRRTGKFRGFNTLKEGWESFSNFWLEYRFGWRILAYDIQAIDDYYKRRNDGRLLFTRRASGEFSSIERKFLKTAASGLGVLEMWAIHEHTEEVRVGYSAFIDQAVLGNPIALNTLYDITPWTLVVDMFFNVQNNIIALSKFPIGIDEVPDSGFVSSKRTTSTTILANYIPKKAHQYMVREVTPCNLGMNRSYNRLKSGDPSFDVTFQPNLDLGKIIDLATLALPILRTIRRLTK